MMAPFTKTIRNGVAAVAGFSLVGLGLTGLGLTGLGLTGAARAQGAPDQNADLVKRGQYLVTAGDCVACHTAPGGKPFAGGLYMDTPVGKISTPNLTPDKETGLGNWTDGQFYNAFHNGIDDQGAYLYPAFPFPWYTKVTKDDAQAIHAYLKSLPAVHAPRKPLEMGFPFNIRTALFTWRTLFFSAETFEPSKTATPEVNRGAYLVEGLGHCGECHNKSKLTGASNWSGKLEGGQIEGWYAPNIMDGRAGVGTWKKDDIVAFLKNGSRPDHLTVALGPMQQVISESTSHLSDPDLNAIAAYLKSTAPTAAQTGAESSKGAAPQRVAADAYLSNCASCHQKDGKGVGGAIPQLAGNGAVTAAGPENVIRVVLGGLGAKGGMAPMPALGQTMTDKEVADAVNYVRSTWGNHASADVGPAAIADLRKNALTMLAMNRPDACVPVKDAAKDPTLEKAVDDGAVTTKLDTMNRAAMLTTIDEVLPAIRQKAPDAKPDMVTNALTAAYCPIAMKLPGGQKSESMGNFAVLVYGQAIKKDIKLDSGDSSAAPAPKPTP